MIGEGTFQAHLSLAETILNHLEILDERQRSPNKRLGASHFKGLDYREIYNECVREFAYDFRLVDQSLLLFVKGGNDCHNGSLSFSFYESPVRVSSYVEFVAGEIGLSPDDEDFKTSFDSWGDSLRPDYEQYVHSVEAKNLVTPLRYDYKATDYKMGVHPASHIHFGFDNDIQ